MSTALPYWRRKPLQGALLMVLTTLLQTMNARAEEPDITYEVPINIVGLTAFIPGKIPSGTLYFGCEVGDATYFENFAIFKFFGFGTKYDNTIVVNAAGNFSGTKWWGASFYNKNDLAKAKRYRCDLLGQLQGASAHRIEIGDGSQWWHAKSGTPRVEGPIP